jgi:hypothetical protein
MEFLIRGVGLPSKPSASEFAIDREIQAGRVGVWVVASNRNNVTIPAPIVGNILCIPGTNLLITEHHEWRGDRRFPLRWLGEFLRIFRSSQN